MTNKYKISELAKDFGIATKELISLINASLLVFGINSLAILIVVAFVTVVVATFLPVWSAARKKPVESIRAL